ncbi:hypothetical protein CEXT_350741 [Caerostris extrusa]|uniref:Uncharacterized protein n=1 Tax=Caerostris extrusa TaxID=172846 RepID=A0AAV4VV11_CAEEX|nr:hypothetical protein CEXT_350741 [Caerostris extrusa]
MQKLPKNKVGQVMLENDDFSDYGYNISDNEENNDVENGCVDLIDNDMVESDNILIDEEMHTIHSNNRKRIPVIFHFT